MLVINSSHNAAQVQLVALNNDVDYVYVAARSRVDLPSGYTIDPAWAASNPKVKSAPEVTTGTDND